MGKDRFEKSRHADAVHDFISLNHLHRATVENSMEKLGLHRSQHIMLICIMHKGPFVTQKEIAAALEISPAAVTSTVKKLEADGYVKRTTDGDDGRCNKIGITEKGKKVLEMSRLGFAEIDTAMFEGFSDEEIEQFKEYVARMKDNLKKIVPKEKIKHEEN